MSPLFKRGGGDDSGGRSAEDRERARLEREARRREKRGEPAPDLFDADSGIPTPPPDEILDEPPPAIDPYEPSADPRSYEPDAPSTDLPVDPAEPTADLPPYEPAEPTSDLPPDDPAEPTADQPPYEPAEPTSNLPPHDTEEPTAHEPAEPIADLSPYDPAEPTADQPADPSLDLPPYDPAEPTVPDPAEPTAPEPTVDEPTEPTSGLPPYDPAEPSSGVPPRDVQDPSDLPAADATRSYRYSADDPAAPGPRAYESQAPGPTSPAAAPDDPLVPPPAPGAPPVDPQPTAEIPAHELPDQGASFADENGPYTDDVPVAAPPRPSFPRPSGTTPPPPLRRTQDTARRGRGGGGGGGAAAGRGAAGSAGKPRRGRRWAGRIFAVLALLLTAAAIWFIVSLFQPLKGDASSTRVTVVVPKGADAGQIGDLLERRGVISSSFFFGLRARLAGKRTDLKPGVYRLRQDSSYGDVLDVLSKGPPPEKKVAITIPEGRSRTEEAKRIRTNSSLTGSYLAATKHSPVLKPQRYGAPRSTPSLEGFLFPSTYEIKQGSPVKLLANQQLAAFKRAIRRVNMGAARRKNLSTYDVLTIASMVEREAMLRRERPIIAGVIYNRLKNNIPLGIDATIRYATGNWLRPLTQSQLKVNSAYNTRTHQGLPPTPIGSPGLASIRAAAHPKRTPYLYYVVKPGGCGEHVFTRTFAEFQRASARYNSARSARGGKSPDSCPK